MNDDLGASYTGYRSDLPEQQAGAALLKEMQGQQQPEQPKEVKPPKEQTQETPTAAPDSPASQAINARAQELQQGPGVSERLQAHYGDQVQQVLHDRASSELGIKIGKIGEAGAESLQNAASAGLSVVKDIGKGVFQEGARAVYTGVNKGVGNTYDKLDDLAAWADKNIGIENKGLPIPGMDPNTKIADVVRQWMDKRSVKDPESVTGQIISGVAQFVTGMALTRSMGGITNPFAQTATAGATAFDYHAQNLGNLLEKVPALQPIASKLASNPDDPKIVGMAKNALDGVIGGKLVDGFIKSLRLFFSMAPKAVEGATRTVPEEPFGILGDEKKGPSEPLLQTKPAAGREEPSAPNLKEGVPTEHAGAIEDHLAMNHADIPEETRSALAARYQEGAAQKPEFDQKVQEISQEIGAKNAPLIPDMKGTASAVKKAMEDYEGDASRIKDLVRATVVIDNPQQAEAAIAAAKAKFGEPTSDIRNSISGADSPTLEGYRDIKMNFDINGHTVELQMNTPEMLAAKNEAHPLYKKAQEIERLGEDKTPEQAKQMTALREKQKAIYDEAWAFATKERNLDSDTNVPLWLKDEDLNQRPSGTSQALQTKAGVSEQGTPSTSANEVPSGNEAGNISTPPTGAIVPGMEGKGAPNQVPSSAAGREMEPQQTYINFARIDAPNDVQRVMQEIANAREAPKDQARAGVMSFQDMKASASQQNAWNILKARNEGQPLPPDQMVAARQLWLSSTSKLIETARVAQAAPTEENLFAVRKMMEVHGWISDQVTGAATAAARSVGSMRIPVGPSESRMQEIADRLDSVAGGADNVKDIANRIVSLSDSSSPDAAHQLQIFGEKSVWARTRDATIQFFRDALLSSPVSQARILASNVSTALWRIGERKVAEGISAAMQTEGGIAPGEASAMWAGWIGSFKDAMTYGWKAAQTGATGAGIGDVPHEQFPSMLSGEALNMKGAPGRIADFVGQAASWGFGFGGRRAIIAQHDMALTMAYNAELHAQAVRVATNEINAGQLAEDGFAERVAGLLHSADGTPDESIATAARAQAKYQAFLDQPADDTIGKLTNLMLDARRQIPALNAIIPFIKIPSRIMSYTFERTPLAPLMSEFRSKVAAGGASRDLALAQLAVGGMITSAAADMVLSGKAKGGGPPEKGLAQAEEREGEKRDSVKVGDNWYNINGVHPVGKLFLLATDVAEAIAGGQHELKDDEDTTKIAVGTSLAIARTLTNASYMQGLSNLFATLHDAKVGGEGESALLSVAGETVPAAANAVTRATDPYQRAVYTMLDEYKSKIPGLSKTLPPRRDLWGDPVSSGHDALTRLTSPVQFASETHSPIDDEILKQGMNITMPGRNQSFGPPGQGVRIDMSKYPKEYSRLLELAGHEYKDPAWGVGAKELLSSIVSGDHPLSTVYNLRSDGPEGGKAEMIRGIINQYREGARNQLLEESPKLSNQVDDLREKMQALKVPQ
jgi:hypothetical protein